MLLYRQGSDMPARAQASMNSATQAMASQQKQTTTTTEKKTDFWDDFGKAANAIGAGARAVNGIIDTANGAINLYDDVKTKNAYDNVAKAFREGGYEAIQNNPEMQDYYHSRALGMFVKDRANTQQGFLDMMKRGNEIADQVYQDWRGKAIGVLEAYKKGDREKFGALLQQLTETTPMPYRVVADGKGNFTEMFRSDQSEEGFVATGRTYTPEQAVSMIENIMKGEQMVLRGVDGKVKPYNSYFNMGIARNLNATSLSNADNATDFKKQTPLYDRNGFVSGVAMIKNSLENYNQPKVLEVYAADGRRVGTFNNYPELMQATQGKYSPFPPAKGALRAAARGGGGGRAGNARAGNFKVGKDDKKMFLAFATSEDPDTGAKTTDYGKAAILEEMQRRTGASAMQLMGLYQKNQQQLIQKGYSPREAEKQVQMDLRRRLDGQRQTGAPQPGQQEKTGRQQAAPQKNSAADSRILDAAGRHTEGKDKNEEGKRDAHRPLHEGRPLFLLNQDFEDIS